MSRWIFAGALLLALSVLSTEAQITAASTSTSGALALVPVFIRVRHSLELQFVAVTLQQL